MDGLVMKGPVLYTGLDRVALSALTRMRQEPTPAAATPGHSGYVGPVPKTDADEWFEIYLPNHDYTPGDHEPDLTPVGIRSSPDFIPTTPSGEQIVWEAEPPLSRP